MTINGFLRVRSKFQLAASLGKMNLGQELVENHINYHQLGMTRPLGVNYMNSLTNVGPHIGIGHLTFTIYGFR